MKGTVFGARNMYCFVIGNLSVVRKKALHHTLKLNNPVTYL